MTLSRVVLLSILVLAARAAHAAPQEATTTAPATSASVAAGKGLYDQHCAACHGPGGAGGRGADLTRSELDRADTDAALHRVIRQGIAGTEMPGSFQLTDEEIVKVGAYIRSLGRIAPVALPGDRARGQQLFQQQCQVCHLAEGHGGVNGPQMTGIGSRRSAAWIRKKLLDPAETIVDGFRLVELTTKTGRQITGIRMNEDTWSIQLRDLEGRLSSFWKRDLASLTTHADKTPMPSYRSVLSDAQLDDLVVYLATHRERRR